MSALIETLKKQHTAILHMLTQAKSSGLVTIEGYRHLSTAKNALLSHLEKEDQEFYPRLTQLGATDVHLQSTLDAFAQDTEKVTAAVIQFFNKYEHASTDLDFINDVGSLIALLKLRISREENLLYKEYEKRVV